MFTSSDLDELQARLGEMVQDDPQNGIFRARRDMFTDEDLFELEMKHIFEGNWIYMAHESQIPNPNDYFTLFMGRTPVVITRDKTGELHALVNACSHRGAMLCRFKRQNKATFTCPFHGWTFSNTGKLLKVKDPKTGGYPDQFDCDGSHDLNGAGKTTLFNLLVGELKPDTGSIHLAGEDVTALPVATRARRGLSRSYQKNTLFDGLTVEENLALAASVATGNAMSLRSDSLTRPEIREIVDEVANQVNLIPHIHAKVSEVSYGVRRQLEVGVALATRPLVLLMDEPTSGVGPEMAKGFHKLLNDLTRDLTLLIIEHDMDLAFDVADTITVLNYGEVVFDGLPDAARGSSLLKEIYLGSWEDA